MTFYALEFMRRFLLHVLPDRFMKIRYFRFLSHRQKNRCIALIRGLIDPDGSYPERTKETVKAVMERLTGQDITRCPQCRKGRLRAAPLPYETLPSFAVATLDTS